MDETKKPIRVRKISELSDSEKAALTGFHTPAGRKAALQELGVEHNQEFCDEVKPGGIILVDDIREVDPNGVEQHAPGAKLDAGKPDLSLLLYFGRALLDVGTVGTFGAKKYTRGGWQEVQDGENRYTAALLRHLMCEGRGEKYDADSGLLHAAHAAWNALARLELILRREQGSEESRDNRNSEER